MGLGPKTYFDATELYFVQTYDILCRLMIFCVDLDGDDNYADLDGDDILCRLICADLDDDDICADLDGDDILSRLILVQNFEELKLSFEVCKFICIY